MTATKVRDSIWELGVEQERTHDTRRDLSMGPEDSDVLVTLMI
jgi:hypothetical protein